MKFARVKLLSVALMGVLSSAAALAGIKVPGSLLTKGFERTVFVFLSSECPCSDSYVDELNRLALKYSTRGVQFIGVHSNPKEDAQKSREYFAAKKLSFTLLEDADQKILKDFSALKTPHAYIVNNADRAVIYHGGVGSTRKAEPDMRHYLEEALDQGAHPSPSETKTMGCLIERKNS